MVLHRRFDILTILSSLLEYLSDKVNTEENVELMVEQMLTTDFPPTDALSKPTIMVWEICFEKEGTQSVFPFLAMIWRRILVAMDWTFFFPRVDSQATCERMQASIKQCSLIFLYWFFRVLGMATKTMLQPSSAAWLMWFKNALRHFLGSISPRFICMIFSETWSLAEVFLKVWRTSLMLAFWPWMMPSFT